MIDRGQQDDRLLTVARDMMGPHCTHGATLSFYDAAPLKLKG